MSKIIKISVIHEAIVLNSKAIVLFARKKALAIIMPNHSHHDGIPYLTGFYLPGNEDSAHEGGVKSFFNRFAAVNCGVCTENMINRILRSG